MKRVGIVPTGVANVASVAAALRRVGAEPYGLATAGEVERAEFLVLPGVGAFGAAVTELDGRGLRAALVARITSGQRTLCICLGMQLLAEASEESPGARGLGVLPGTLRRFPAGVRVPHFGWNDVQANPRAVLCGNGRAYFANSYRLDIVPAGWLGATAEHGGGFVAALERGGVLACQFHPELSGAYGRGLLRTWLGLETPAC